MSSVWFLTVLLWFFEGFVYEALIFGQSGDGEGEGRLRELRNGFWKVLFWTKLGGWSWVIRTQRCLHIWVRFGEEIVDLRTIFTRRLDLVVNSYRLGHGDDLDSRLRVSRIARTEISVAESLDNKFESLFLVIQERIEIVLKMRNRWVTMAVRRVFVFQRIMVLEIWFWFPDFQEIESLDRSRSYLLDPAAFRVCIQGTEVMFWILKGSVSRAFINKRAQSISMCIGFVLFGNLLVTREFLEVVNVKNDALLIEGAAVWSWTADQRGFRLKTIEERRSDEGVFNRWFSGDRRRRALSTLPWAIVGGRNISESYDVGRLILDFECIEWSFIGCNKRFYNSLISGFSWLDVDTLRVRISMVNCNLVSLRNNQGNEGHNPTHHGTVKGLTGGRNPLNRKVDNK
ncbi:predicted protein [Arabidopsis lyrata subsp. lyrata]|uniref:Predicted protein n=1 Tax=Arabidopsis lyrata subsp. lyrata TaxID=81972 RepID=D7L3M1_ARALL|nr:predicted protein [Arabidopsis lyrata subsp. lyrata]